MALLTLDKLTMRFGGLTAVNAVDCAVEPGAICSIIGPNGAGKTTVFNAITGIYEPTSGTITFDGQPLRRAWTWRTLLLCVVVGLLTGVAAMLSTVGVDPMWRATIKRNYAGPGQPFSYRQAADSAVAYLRGDLAIERLRSGRYSITAVDGGRTLAFADTLGDARQLRMQMQAEPLFQQQAAARRLTAWLALGTGIVVGSAGTWAVWNRARRTPDVIARAGIARTFQNIRLFHNMTVLENVLMGREKGFRVGPIGMVLRTPGQRREEAEHERVALELLEFVGLRAQCNNLAKNLPYGDQRRLEIARALATEPRLVLLDEPAAGMNPSESVGLTQLIERIRQRGVTVLLIEHHMKVVMGISDRVVVLDYGVKIAEGTPEQVRTNPAVIAAYLGDEEVT